MYPDQDGYLLQQWFLKCRDKNNSGKVLNFIRSTRSVSPTSGSGATTLPPKGDSFVYNETKLANSDKENVFVCFERTDVIQFSNIIFYYN